MSSTVSYVKGGTKITCDTSTLPRPRPRMSWPIPSFSGTGQSLLSLTLVAVAETGRSGVQVTSTTSSLPGTSAGVWTLFWAAYQGDAPDPMTWNSVPVTWPSVSILLDNVMSSASFVAFLRRVEAGQTYDYAQVQATTPSDPTQDTLSDLQTTVNGMESDSVLSVSEKPYAISTYNGLYSQVTTLRAQATAAGATMPAQNTLLAYLQGLGTAAGPSYPWNDTASGHHTAIPDPAAWTAQWGTAYTEIAALTANIAAKLASDTATKLSASGTAANALLLNGYAPSVVATANTIAQRDAAGGINAGSSTIGGLQFFTDSTNGGNISTAPGTALDFGILSPGAANWIMTVGHGSLVANFPGGVAAASGTFTGAGDIISLAGINGNYSHIRLDVGGVARWRISRDNGSETGSNAGSDIALFAYSDTGGYVGQWFKMTRSTGAATFAGASLTTNALLATNGGFNGSVSITGTLTVAGQYLNVSRSVPASMNQYISLNGGVSVDYRIGRTAGSDNIVFQTWDGANLFTRVTIDTAGVGIFAGDVASSGGRLRLRNDSIEDSITNAASTVNVNYAGYLQGNTQWRDFVVYDGKYTECLRVTASSKTTAITGTLTSTVQRLGLGTYAGNDTDTFATRNAKGCHFGRCHQSTDAPDQINYFQYIQLPEAPGAVSHAILAIGGTGVAYLGYGAYNAAPTWEQIYTSKNIDTAPASLQAVKSLVTAPQVGLLANRPAASSYPKGYYYATDATAPDGLLGALYYSDGTSWGSALNPQTIAGRIVCGTLSAGSAGVTSMAAQMIMTGTIQSLPYTAGASGVVPSGFRFSGNTFLSTFYDGTQAYVQGEIGGNVNMIGYKVDGLALAKISGTGYVEWTTPGTYTWVCPRNITEVTLTLIGGGASGCSLAASCYGGGGGGALKVKAAVTPGTSYSIVVGAGGTVAISASGNNGGDSTGLGYTAQGGRGSGVGGLITGPAGTLAGGAQATGTKGIPGIKYIFACAGAGGNTAAPSLLGGSTDFFSGGTCYSTGGGGGASAMGAGGAGSAGSSTLPVAGSGYGGGGGGCTNSTWNSGAGAPGYARIDY